MISSTRRAGADRFLVNWLDRGGDSRKGDGTLTGRVPVIGLGTVPLEDRLVLSSRALGVRIDDDLEPEGEGGLEMDFSVDVGDPPLLLRV